MKLNRMTLLSAIITIATAGSAIAHPGHGVHETNAWHLLTSPDHLTVMGVSGAIVGIGLCVMVYRRLRQNRR